MLKARTRRRTTWLCAALLVFAATTTVGLPSASAADPYELYAVEPMTGPGAFGGKADVNALSVIESMVNSSGGIRGRQIKFVVEDDQSNPSVAVQLLSGIIAKHVPVVLGSTLAATCNAMAATIKDGPVQYCFSPGVHPPSGSFSFSAGPSTLDQLTAIVRYLRDRGVRKVAILTSTDATGQDADRIIDGLFGDPANRSLTIVDREHFTVGDVSVAAQIARVKESSPDLLIAWTTGTPLGTVLRNAHDGGLGVPVLTSSGNMSTAQLAQYGDFLPAELLFPGLPAFSPDQLPGGPMKRAVLAFLDAFKPSGTHPEAGENQVWDATLIVIEALKKYGLDATPEQLRGYIANLHDWTGIYGSYNFGAIPQRGVGVGGVIIQRWDPARGRFIALSQPGGAALK